MNKSVAPLFLAGLVISFAAGCSRTEGTAPSVSFNREFKALGRTPSLSLTIADAETGLRHVTIQLKQKDQNVALLDETFEKTSAPKSKTYDVGKLHRREVQNRRTAPPALRSATSDLALRNYYQRKRSRRATRSSNSTSRLLSSKFSPVSTTSTRADRNVWSIGYRLMWKCRACRWGNVSSRVIRFLPLRPDKRVYFALFALQYDDPVDVPMKVIARDAAGNEVKADFWHKVFPKKFRTAIFRWTTPSFRRLFPKSRAARRTSRMKATSFKRS